MKERRMQNAKISAICSLRFAICNLKCSFRGILLALFFLAVCLTASCSFAEDEKKVVIPFDFVSKFDNGRYGQIVGEMIWKKLDVKAVSSCPNPCRMCATIAEPSYPARRRIFHLRI